MALDRQSIEKRDFPIGRRGYEPEAVDEHLARIAAEVDELRRQAGQRSKASPASLAQAASEQVRAIVEAAETSAADIERQAEDDAQRIRSEAEAEARRTRDDAIARSQGHVGEVREATQLMLQRVDAMESELTALIESLRTGANRLNADLKLLEGNMGELYDARGAATVPSRPAPARAPEPAPASEPAAAPAPPAPAPEPAPAREEPAAAAAPASEPPAPAAEPEPLETSAGGGGDIEGARLVALNMALNGQSRDETDRYLADNFDLDDRQALLDEVYSTVEG